MTLEDQHARPAPEVGTVVRIATLDKTGMVTKVTRFPGDTVVTVECGPDGAEEHHMYLGAIDF